MYIHVSTCIFFFSKNIFFVYKDRLVLMDLFNVLQKEFFTNSNILLWTDGQLFSEDLLVLSLSTPTGHKNPFSRPRE